MLAGHLLAWLLEDDAQLVLTCYAEMAKYSTDHCSPSTAATLSSVVQERKVYCCVFSLQTLHKCSAWGGLRLSSFVDTTSVFLWFFWCTREQSAGLFPYFFSCLHSCWCDDWYLMSEGKRCAGLFTATINAVTSVLFLLPWKALLGYVTWQTATAMIAEEGFDKFGFTESGREPRFIQHI